MNNNEIKELIQYLMVQIRPLRGYMKNENLIIMNKLGKELNNYHYRIQISSDGRSGSKTLSGEEKQYYFNEAFYKLQRELGM